MKFRISFHPIVLGTLLASALLVFPHFSGYAQLRSLGLDGRIVFSLRSYGGKLYAGTDDGAYLWLPSISDTTWKSIGLKGKNVRAIYPHQYGPISYAVTAGIGHPYGDPDSVLTFCTFGNDTAWAPTDTGMDRSAVRSINSVDGFPSMAICGETYAAGAEKIYVREPTLWKQTFTIGGVVNVVRTHSLNTESPTVWAAGETNIFWPYIAHSHDKGATWTITYPYLAGDNACNSFAFDPTDSLTVYAGMEGVVIKSTDGGHTWDTTALRGTPYYFYGLAFDGFTRSIFAAGASHDPQAKFGLYQSTDGGGKWKQITSTDYLTGALCLEIVPTAIPEDNWLLIGTLGTGVKAYMIGLTSTPAAPLPQQTKLEQNYPNPFNPISEIGFRIAAGSFVTLAVYDLLGNEVATLVNERRAAGAYVVQFNGADLASGVYFYRLEAGSYTQTKKMVLIK